MDQVLQKRGSTFRMLDSKNKGSIGRLALVMLATTLRLSRRTLPLASKRLFSAGGSIWQNCVAPPDIPGLKVKTAFDAAKNPTGHVCLQISQFISINFTYLGNHVGNVGSG